MDVDGAGRMCVSPVPSSFISARIQTKGYSPPTVTRLHRYEWNSNWPRNVQWANGSALRPDWPAQCLVCQGEGLFGLHLQGLCVCGGGVGGRDKEQAGQTRVHISEAALDLLHRQVRASERARPAGDWGVSVPPFSGVFLERLGVKVIRRRCGGTWHFTLKRFCFSVRRTGSAWLLLVLDRFTTDLCTFDCYQRNL